MMADRISPQHRSWNMSRIRGKDTKPEMILRSLMHREGYRFRLHDRNLPGKPDLILPKHNTVIFVNGCYWHRHESCPKATTPKTNTEFWEAKFKDTIARDARKSAQLTQRGWRVITIWECDLLANAGNVVNDIRHQLVGGSHG